MRGRQAEEPGITHEAFAVLVEQWQRRLHAFARGLVGNDEQARDLVQDTFHDAWRGAQKGDPPFTGNAQAGDVRRWFFHVTYNKALSALRRKRLIRWESLEQLTEPALSPDAAPIAFETVLAEGDALQAALAQLSSPDVACLLLRVVHGFSATEVGAIVGANPDTVIKRLSRAKQRLRAVYFAQNAQIEEQTRR